MSATKSLEARALPERRGGSATIWIVGAVLAGIMHAAAAAAFLATAPVEAEDDEGGAPAIEIGIELASPRQDASDLPAGPESDAAAASTATMEQRVAPEKTDAPQEKPVESEEPDRVVAPDRPEDTETTERVPVRETSERSAESSAAEATANPTVAAVREAPVTTAPTQGTGASGAKVRSTWQRQLIGHLNRSKRYPTGSARRDAEILVSFTIDRTGQLLDAHVTRSSGDPAFDEAALAMVRRAAPLPAPPAVVADDGLTFALPVIFKPSGRS